VLKAQTGAKDAFGMDAPRREMNGSADTGGYPRLPIQPRESGFEAARCLGAPEFAIRQSVAAKLCRT